MLSAHSLVVVEYDPETRRMVPVPLDTLNEDYCGWTLPPEGMPLRLRERWHVARKRAIKEGVAPDMAWYLACREASEDDKRFKARAQKKCFRR